MPKKYESGIPFARLLKDEVVNGKRVFTVMSAGNFPLGEFDIVIEGQIHHVEVKEAVEQGGNFSKTDEEILSGDREMPLSEMERLIAQGSVLKIEGEDEDKLL